MVGKIKYIFLICTILISAQTFASNDVKEISKDKLAINLSKLENTGVGSFLDPIKDLNVKKDYTVNSWFIAGNTESEGHKISYLYHLMLLNFDKQNPMVVSVISITDETTGWYYGEDKVYPISATSIANDKFDITVPNGKITGDLNKMHVEAQMPYGKINVDLEGYGGVLYNGGTGVFPLLEMNINQYSIPDYRTTGTLQLENKTYKIENGKTWFDRQWQMQGAVIPGKWSWMDINLDNGDVISLWKSENFDNKKIVAWATILHKDGTQSTMPIEILESNNWTSEKSKQTYPTYWIVKIPDYNAVLEVIPTPQKQEIVSVIPFLHKYEGASSIKGTYRNQKVSGFGYVELVGEWK